LFELGTFRWLIELQQVPKMELTKFFGTCKILKDGGQRVLNDLQRNKLSCVRIIQLLAHPLPHFPDINLSLILGLPVCHRSGLLTGEGGEWSLGKELNHTTA
jgi:hypothetical protein